MDIIAFYKPLDLTLVKNQHGVYAVVKKHKDEPAEILYKGDQELCNKTFIMLVAGFLN